MHKSIFSLLYGLTYLGAALMALTAIGKFITVFISWNSMTWPDPLFQFLSIRIVILISAALELAGSILLFSKISLKSKSAIISWIATLLMMYRIALSILGAKLACNCLGIIASWFHLSKSTSDIISATLLFYLLTIGYLGLFFSSYQRYLIKPLNIS